LCYSLGKRPKNTEINFTNSVPTLRDDAAGQAFGVFEQNSILRYISCKYLTNTHWYPWETKARTRIDMFLDFLESTIRTVFRSAGTCWLGATNSTGDIDPSKSHMDLTSDLLYGSTHPAWEGRADNGLRAQLQCINDRWLKEGKYIAGNYISIADVAFYADCGYIIHLFDIDFKQYPNMNQWYERMDTEFGGFSIRKEHINVMKNKFGTALRKCLPNPPNPLPQN